MVCALASRGSAGAAANLGFACDSSTLRGSYGTELSGFTSPDGIVQIPIATVGLFKLDGRGRLVGGDSLSVGGNSISRQWTGTYSVESDCRATFTVSTVSDSPESATLSGVVVEGGRSVLLIQTDPAGTTSAGRAQRVGPAF